MRITKAQALEALDSLDDFARMTAGVDAYGPRDTLRQYIERPPLWKIVGVFLVGAALGLAASWALWEASVWLLSNFPYVTR